MSESREVVTVTARLKDPELADALQSAASDSSKTAVIRDALRSELLDSEPDDSEVTPDQSRALRAMREQAGSRNRLPVEVAETVVANRLNIPKSSVRSAIFAGLRRAGKISVVPRTYDSAIIIRGGPE